MILIVLYIIYIMKKVIINQKQNEKKNNNKIDDNLFNKEEHITALNKLFLNEEFEGDKQIKQEITKKRNSYKNQDRKKNRLKDDIFISYEELLEKMVISKLKCNYCKDDMLLIYKNKRENKQWTLDRIDNKICHSSLNTVISCLSCNLQKRTRDDNKFRYTKQMRLIKKN